MRRDLAGLRWRYSIRELFNGKPDRLCRSVFIIRMLPLLDPSYTSRAGTQAKLELLLRQRSSWISIAWPGHKRRTCPPPVALVPRLVITGAFMFLEANVERL